ncbi:MAG TPA: 4Fe-4S binding protein [Syntrophomonadaceae bacterium]|nr:4Fe-4S binding protein [Syntrophomonadaceae bacterium]
MYKIIQELCTACGLCADVCPVEAISPIGPSYVIDQDICTVCGICEDDCPVEAIQFVE